MASDNSNTEREVHLAALTKAYSFLAEALDPAGVQPPLRNSSNNGAQLRNIAPSGHHQPRSRLDVNTLRHDVIYLEEYSSSEEEDDVETFFPHQHLQSENFSEDDLIYHLRNYSWDTKATHTLLGALLINTDNIKSNLLIDEKKSWNHDSQLTHFAVVNIGRNGRLIRHDGTEGTRRSRNEHIWRMINGTNVEFAHAVGKIAVIGEPSPSMFAALHLTMSPHFDMDHVFRILSDDSATRGYMRGCLEEEPRQQRSFAFCLKYHTLVGDERDPMPWQLSSTERSEANPLSLITACSSVVALSLEGSPMASIRARSDSVALGHVFDPFSPWRVLSIQCFPDWKSSVKAIYKFKTLLNGPEAFLWVTLNEYRDAIKRLSALSSLINKLFTPPANSMFNEHVRDRLLFEDDEFTQSRRYFWAVLALEAIADDIHGLIVAYQNTFTDDVWTGNHKYIWPGTKESSSRHAFWRKRMLRLRNLFEKEMDALKELHAENELSQKKIRSLAEDMSRATNVYGARKNIEQQAITVFQSHNIKMLALVTIWFLPLIFVADIFGMTNMPAHGSFVHLAITLVCVCLPVYAFMGLLNTGGGFGSSYWKKRFGGFKGRFKLSKTRPPPAAKFMYHDSQGNVAPGLV